MLHSLLLLALLAPLADTNEAELASPKPAPQRIAIIGASVSYGFGLSLELEVNCMLTPFVDAALLLPQEETLNLSDGSMFMGPISRGQDQLERALDATPTVILGGDFPFWFGYGSGNLEGRMQRLERGLKLLEQVEGHILLGDFPDMSPAVNGSCALMGGGPIIHASQIPSVEEQAKLNERLREWATGRENVHLFAMSSFVQSLTSPEPLEIRGNVIDVEAKQLLLQADLLHPTVKGTALFTILMFDKLVQDGVFKEDQVEWDLGRLEAAAWEATQAERDKRAEKRRRREERKRKLEERKRAKQAKEAQKGTMFTAA